MIERFFYQPPLVTWIKILWSKICDSSHTWSTSAEEREREVSKRAIEAEMGIKMPEWEWKASKKGKGKGKGKGKKSSLQEPSTSKPPTSTDLKTTQGSINIFRCI